MLPKTEIIPADYYQGYLDLITEEDVNKALEKNTRQLRKFLQKIPRKKVDYAYAPGKWTIREMVQHMIDAERVFTYRALRYARKDATPLPGFDENAWASNSNAASRSWNDLRDEFRAVRSSTEYLFCGLSDDQLQFRGEANGRTQNAFTVGFLIPGHAAHHIRILKERYL